MAKLYEEEEDHGNNGKNAKTIYAQKNQDEEKMKQEWKEKMKVKSTKWKFNKSVLILIFIVLSTTYAHGMKEENNNNNILVQIATQSKTNILENCIIKMVSDNLYDDLFKLYCTCRTLRRLLQEELYLPLLCARNSRIISENLRALKGYYPLFKQLQVVNPIFEKALVFARMRSNTQYTEMMNMQLIYKADADKEKVQYMQQIMKQYDNVFFLSQEDNRNGAHGVGYTASNEVIQVVQNEAAWVRLNLRLSRLTSASFYYPIKLELDGIQIIKACTSGFLAIQKIITDGKLSTNLMFWTNALYDNSKFYDITITKEDLAVISISDYKIYDIVQYANGAGFTVVLQDNTRIEIDLKQKYEEIMKDSEREETITNKSEE